MKNIMPLILIVLFSSFILGCVTFGYNEAFLFANLGKYDEAIRYIDEKKQTMYTDNDQVLYLIEKGLLHHYSGDYKTSFLHLSDAEKQIFTYYSKSVSQKVGSYILNDTVVDYSGEDFEDIYINIFNALNFIKQNDIDSAFVEIRRFDNKQRELSSKYAASIAEAKSLVNKNIDTDIDNHPEFHNSALARYLSMIMYRSIGDIDSATIDRAKIDNAFYLQSKIYDFSQPKNLDDELYIPKQKARLNCIAFSGLSPLKTEVIQRIPYVDSNKDLNYIQIALPTMEKQNSQIKTVFLEIYTLENQLVDKIYLSPFESIENIAFDTFSRKQPLIYFRSIARSIAKTTTRESFNVAVKKSDSTALGILNLLSIGMDIANKITERADIRGVRCFPALASVGGVNLDEGVYNIKVYFCGYNNQIIKQESFDNYTIKTNQLNLLESVCLN